MYLGVTCFVWCFVLTLQLTTKQWIYIFLNSLRHFGWRLHVAIFADGKVKRLLQLATTEVLRCDCEHNWAWTWMGWCMLAERVHSLELDYKWRISQVEYACTNRCVTYLHVRSPLNWRNEVQWWNQLERGGTTVSNKAGLISQNVRTLFRS